MEAGGVNEDNATCWFILEALVESNKRRLVIH